jgi:hypothetical protein
VAAAAPLLRAARDATERVECRKDEDVVDEAPAAYKDITR